MDGFSLNWEMASLRSVCGGNASKMLTGQTCKSRGEKPDVSYLEIKPINTPLQE